VLVARWSFGLLKTTSNVLLDRSAPQDLSEAITTAIQSDIDEVVDLHVWPVGPSIYSAIVAIATSDPKSPDRYRSMIPSDSRLVHVTIEVNDLR